MHARVVWIGLALVWLFTTSSSVAQAVIKLAAWRDTSVCRVDCRHFPCLLSCHSAWWRCASWYLLLLIFAVHLIRSICWLFSQYPWHRIVPHCVHICTIQWHRHIISVAGYLYMQSCYEEFKCCYGAVGQTSVLQFEIRTTQFVLPITNLFSPGTQWARKKHFKGETRKPFTRDQLILTTWSMPQPSKLCSLILAYGWDTRCTGCLTKCSDEK